MKHASASASAKQITNRKVVRVLLFSLWRVTRRREQKHPDGWGLLRLVSPCHTKKKA
jgi:hypothetical protein